MSVIPGHPDACGTQDEAMEAAHEIGFPVMIKAAAGGGGKGMRIARSAEDLREGSAPQAVRRRLLLEMAACLLKNI